MPRLGIRHLAKPLTPLPLITLLAVKNGETLSGMHPLIAITSFGMGVAKIDFQAKGRTGAIVIGPAIARDGLWGATWNTAAVPNGTYVLRAIAYGSAGGRSVSKGIRVRLNNAG